MKNTKIKTLSKETVIKWGWAPTSGRVEYDIKVGKPGTELTTKRTSYVGRIVYLWGMARKGTFAEPWVNEEWI